MTVFKRISVALTMALAVLLGPSIGLANAETGKGAGCERLIIDRSQHYTDEYDVLAYEQWQYNAGTARCWQVHHIASKRMKFRVNITKTHRVTGAKTVVQKVFGNKRAFMVWGCHSLKRYLVDIEVWGNSDRDGKYDDAYYIVNLAAH